MLTHNQYQNAFGEFAKRTKEREDVLKWMRTSPESLQLHQNKRILSIGAGTGSFDVALLDFMPQAEHYAVVEPNEKHIQDFKDRVGGDTRFKFHQSHFEECIIGADFDMVLMSHCLYYLDRDMAFEMLPLHTKSILIYHQSEYGINYIQRLFGDAACRPLMYCSKDIERDLKSRELPFKKFRVDSYIDVSNPNGLLVDFFLEKKTSASEQERVISFLEHKYPNGKMYSPMDIIKIDLEEHL